MSVLFEWVRNTTLIMLLLSCLEMVLPGGSMKQYLKFVFSLILLAVMAAPISNAFLPQTESASGYVPVSPENFFSGDGWMTPGVASGKDGGENKELTRVQTKQIAQVYEEKLTQQLVSGLEEKFAGITVESVEIYINNEIHSGRYARPEKAAVTISDPALEDDVRTYTADLLQIEKRNVSIAFSEE